MPKTKKNPFLFRGELKQFDPELSEIISKEEERQARKLIMIASESICPEPVRSAMSTVFNNVYAEGYPNPRMTRDERDEFSNWERSLSYHRRYSDWRYYKGTDYADYVEALAMMRCAEMFANDDYPAEKIYANVQPLSGAAANNAVYNAFLKPGDVVMGMNLAHGGHLTHGSPVNRSGKNFTIVPYHVHAGTGQIDFAEMERAVKEYKPKMIIAGYSAYPWAVDWAKFREICDMVPGGPAKLVADISHPVGLVVTGLIPSPIGYADAITFTTHKTLCGPRGAAVVTTDEATAKMIDIGVFPGEQGGPHLHQIAAKAVGFKLANTDEFRELQKQVQKNAIALAEAFKEKGMKVAYGGTDTHLMLVDLKAIKTPSGRPLTGEIASRILDMIGIVANKNTILGDESAAHPTAVRFGTTWLTQRGMKEKEMERIADIATRALTNIYAYSYHFATGPAGRGKIDPGLFCELKKEVQTLECSCQREFDPETDETSYPHFIYPCEVETPKAAFVKDDKGGEPGGDYVLDLSDYPVIEFLGERASAMISDTVTANVFAKDDEAAMATLVFETGDTLLDDVALIKDGPERYLMVGHPERAQDLLEWYRGHSDGYLLFDEKDYIGKIQGPVVVNDRKDDFATFLVTGEKAAGVLAACDIPADVKTGGMKKVSALGCEMYVGSLEGTVSGKEAIVLLVPRNNAKEVWGALEKNKGGFKTGGGATERKISAAAGIPSGDGKCGILDLYEKVPARFDLTKTFFIGSRTLREKVKLDTKKKKYEYKPVETPLRKSCLYDEHLKLTKKSNVVPFAGWEMPVIYTSITEEHMNVRRGAGLFDVSHMGVIEVSGKYATRFLNIVTSNYLDWILPGNAIYGYLLYPNGECVDDILMYKRAEDNYMIVVNAVNAEKDLDWLNAVNSGDYIIDESYPAASLEDKVTIRDLKDPSAGDDQIVDVALQGPAAIKVLMKAATSDEQRLQFKRMNRNNFFKTELFGIPMYVARTGYTGEKFGFEFYMHPDRAPEFWNQVLDIGEEFGVKPAGLGARDSTRTEAGLPLYGHELEGEYGITPIEAGYGPFVKFHKPFWIGRSHMIENDDNHTMEVVRFMMDDPKIRMMKPGYPIATMKGQFIGYVTSSAKAGDLQIGLAYVLKKHTEPGTKIAVYTLPRSGKGQPGCPITDMKPGDKLLVYDTGRIISRFPEKGIMESTLESQEAR